jgi:hypothetical protein
MLGIIWIAGIVLLSAGQAAALPTSLPPCTGDCDASKAVTVDEILIGVNIALGQRPLPTCDAFDRDDDRQLTVDELVSGVDSALNGCRPPPAEGPFITALTLVRPDDIVINPVGSDSLGREIFVRPFGSGFSVIVEARRGPSGAVVGHEVFARAPFPPTLRPDIQLIVSAPLGDGSAEVCDTHDGAIGGVPAAEPFGFDEHQAVTDVINEMSCRVDDGARTSDRDACTLSPHGDDFGYAFVDESSEAQFCVPIARAWALPVGDTVIAVRVLDILGYAGEIREIVVRVLPAR